MEATVVIATRNRWASLHATLTRLECLPERPAIIVVDNASGDGTPALVAGAHPSASVVALPRNMGAAARTVGARRARTRYVAFSDDDSWWDPGALPAAVEVLDADPGAGLAAARVLVEPGGRLDPTSACMARGPFDAAGRRGGAGRRSVSGFLACAVVVRRSAFLAAGGFDEHLLIGGEEELVALELSEAGWRLLYAPEATARHRPSPARDPRARRRLLAANGLIVAACRLPAAAAGRRAWTLARRTPVGETAGVVASTGALAPWAWWRRRPVEAPLAARFDPRG